MRVSTPGFLHRGQFASGQLLRGAEFLNSSNRPILVILLLLSNRALDVGNYLGHSPRRRAIPLLFSHQTSPEYVQVVALKLLRSIGFVEVRAEIDQVRQK